MSIIERNVIKLWPAFCDRYGRHENDCDRAQPDCSCGMQAAYRKAMVVTANAIGDAASARKLEETSREEVAAAVERQGVGDKRDHIFLNMLANNLGIERDDLDRLIEIIRKE